MQDHKLAAGKLNEDLDEYMKQKGKPSESAEAETEGKEPES